MGILTRMMNESWLIEVREKWYFEKEKDANEVQKTAMALRMDFKVKLEEIGEKDYITLEFEDSKIKPETLNQTVKIHALLCELKGKYGKRPIDGN